MIRDALANWLLLLVTPPFSGALDARGSARVDWPSGTPGPGFQADCIFVLQQPSGLFAAHTAILEYDT